MALSATTVKNLIVALANQPNANELASAVNDGDAVSAATGLTVAAAITATATSTTTNFGALLVGDLVIAVPAAAGNTIFYTVATAGTLPAAAVVGSLYVVLRAYTAPAATTTTL